MRKNLRAMVLAGTFFAALVSVAAPAKVIFDTDMYTDFDDVGALACLHALADRGECEILGTAVNTKNCLSAAVCEVIDAWCGRPDLPVACVHGSGVERDHAYHRQVYGPTVKRFPEWVKHLNSSDAPDAVAFYRRTLAAQPDGSVTVCSVGFLTNLANLLKSKPDDVSPLDGRALVAKKVKLWVAMACRHPKGREYNSMMDPAASAYALGNWPTPIVFTDFDLGANVFAGRRVADEADADSPIRDVFARLLPPRDAFATSEGVKKMHDCQFGPAGRAAWDETAVLIAVRGWERYFNLERGTFRMVGEKGDDEWIADPKSRHGRVTPKMPLADVGKEIDSLILAVRRPGKVTRTEHAGAYAYWDDRRLTVGNERFSRTWTAGTNGLNSFSFVLGGRERFSENAELHAGRAPLAVTAAPGRFSPASADGLVVTAVCGSLTNRLWVTAGTDGALTAFARPDVVPFDFIHQRVTEFELVDKTDRNNELLYQRERLVMSRESPRTNRCAVLDVQNPATRSGIVFVRLAPLPHARPFDDPDFIVRVAQFGALPFVDVLPGAGFPAAALAYEGGRLGRIRALRDFQRSLRPYVKGRDGLFLSNTWGDSNGDSRISADFLEKEIAAGAEIGVDVIQVDDGWQKGRSSNSTTAGQKPKQRVWSNFRTADPHFWDPDPVRFPKGLKPLADAAKAKGMQFGIWFGPDSENECAFWQEDADCLIDFWKTCGIRYFKIDSMKSMTPLSLARQRAFFDRMLTASAADMTFDLDVTAQIRPGYFGLPDIGPLFVENRYCKNHNFWPHLTLRNMWKLCEVIDPVRLRMEVNNVEIWPDRYGDDPLRPNRYSADTLFAAVMAGSPLGWFENSGLSEKAKAALKPLVARWKLERERMHTGLTVPVGAAPDGYSWTGFAIQAADGKGGYLILFRELDPSSGYTIDVKEILGGVTKAEVIGGRGTARAADGKVTVDVPAKPDFVWVKCE